MRIAVYPGGFDPVTNGHLDLITRMTHLFDRVIVAVVKGRDKGSLFEWNERVELVRRAVEGLPTVEVDGFDGLMVEYAQRKGAVAVVRGIRAVSDYDYEFQMDGMNRQLIHKNTTTVATPETAREILYSLPSRLKVDKVDADTDRYISF